MPIYVGKICNARTRAVLRGRYRETRGTTPHYARSPVPPRCNSHISFFASTQMICLSWTRPDVYRFICLIVAMYVHHLGLYCVLFHRVLIYKTDVALQLTKL